MIYTSSTYNWDKLNEELKSAYQLTEAQKVYCFKNLSHAFFEATHALAQFYPHKKKIVFIKGNSPAIPVVLPRFYKLAYNVTVLSLKENPDFETIKKQIPDDALFVAYAEDHAVTGEFFSLVKDLDRYLNEKKIISLQISHNKHFFEKKHPEPYSVHILAFQKVLSVALAGERVKLLNLLSPEFEWPSGREILQKINFKNHTLNKTVIQSFESKIKDIASPYFENSKTESLSDRSVILLKDVSGDAFCREFLKAGTALFEGAEELISTTHHCYWAQQRGWDSWWEPSPEVQKLGNMLIVSIDLIKKDGFLEHFQQTYRTAQKLTQW